MDKLLSVPIVDPAKRLHVKYVPWEWSKDSYLVNKLNWFAPNKLFVLMFAIVENDAFISS